jgi:predicted nucleic acid-binding protein
VIEVAVTDSTCLIALERIERLDLLRDSFPTVLASPEVIDEFGAVPSWLTVRAVADRALVDALCLQVDNGEAATIALGRELGGSGAAVLDDRKARRVAKRLGIPIIGTVGLIVRAKHRGQVQEVRPLLEALQAAGFWLGDKVVRGALRVAGESVD